MKQNINTWTDQDFLNDLWEDLTKQKFKKKFILPYPELKKEIEDFVHLCDTLSINRLIMGEFRYGKKSIKNLAKYDLILKTQKRINLFLETKNLEYLIDAINMLKLRFFYGLNIGEKLITVDRKD